MNTYYSLNILDLIDSVGEEEVEQIISTFNCPLVIYMQPSVLLVAVLFFWNAKIKNHYWIFTAMKIMGLLCMENVIPNMIKKHINN